MFGGMMRGENLTFQGLDDQRGRTFPGFLGKCRNEAFYRTLFGVEAIQNLARLEIKVHCYAEIYT